MATQTHIPTFGTDIRVLLGRVRRRIRTYVWLEGVSLAIVWLGLTFWIGLAIDYLPVLVGASEMPHQARAVLLAVIALVLAYVLYRWILRRAFARMPNHSMALLLERRFARFHDGLVTSVELAEHPDHAREFNEDMLQQTAQRAQQLTSNVNVGEVFRLVPLVSKLLIAAAFVVSIGVFYVANAGAVQTWFQRLYLLQDEPWPRHAHIEVVGIQIERTSATDGTLSLSEMMRFDENREIKVAKGTSVLVKVRADATKEVIPEYCTIYYQTEGNGSGRVNMQKLGRIRDDYQTYVFDGKPFRGILASIAFDVRGHDHRIRDYHLTVVPSPAIIETKLDCVFPDYMVNEDLSLWLPRTIDLASGTQLPNGTRITIRARSNKDLTRAEIRDLQTDEVKRIDFTAGQSDPRRFDYVVTRLQDSVTLECTLYDVDGVMNDPPSRIFIAGLQDQPPVVDAVLAGIGTAITPSAVIPARGKITDDYDVNECWFDIVINDSDPRRFPIPVGSRGEVDAGLDFRAQRASENALELMPKDKLSLTILASDHCDLADTANVGSGDRYQLDVVTPDELLAMLERRELGLRRRFEQIIDEFTGMRDSLNRVKRDSVDPRGNAPEDARQDEADAGKNKENTGGESAEDPEQHEQSLRRVFTQRAIVQNQKSAQETLGVAASFDDIRQELINNRVDTEDRKVRLKDQIADPLRLVGETMFPELDRLLNDVEAKLDDPAASDAAVDLAIEQADAILSELDKVLQKMLELETFNELVNIVRSLIEDQAELLEKTKKERVNQARNLLK